MSQHVGVSFLALGSLDISELGFASFLAFESLFAGGLAGVVTIVIVLAALSDTSS